MKTSRLLSTAIAAASLLSFSTANAGAPSGTTLQGNNNLTVKAQVTGGCQVPAVTLDFGTYTSGSVVPVSASTTFTITCTNLSNWQMGLGTGTNPGGLTGRQMSFGANSLAYDLTQDTATPPTPWDDTTNYLGGTGTGAPQSVTIYGTIPAGQNVVIGAYTDTVLINVYF